MDRILQWTWDRYGARYFWALCVVMYPLAVPVYLAWSLMIVAFEGSNRYISTAVFTVAALVLRTYLLVLPGDKALRPILQWAAGENVDPVAALGATYAYASRGVVRVLGVDVVWTVVFMVVVGVIAGANGPRLVQYGILGVAIGFATIVISVHSFVEGAFRPPRAAIAGTTGLGDSLPRSRPSFAEWTNICLVASVFVAIISGAMLGQVFDVATRGPLLAVLIATVMTMFTGPSAFASFSPFLRPIRELAAGTERVAAGDYSQRLPVVQDDDLGALAGSFNRMQAGLAERQRLQAAFGTYVDPGLATRLLEQGDDVFSGERREVTVMFVDIRDFTPFAEVNSAEDTVARLNALFEIVVPAVVDVGGHVNKFLGDGALAVFGAPNELAEHADAALTAATVIQRCVVERFGEELRIGVGINTGVVTAGTIGAAGKLEFTLIGDAVNVAARVEQLTKATGDAILLTEETVAALVSPAVGLIDRGSHALKGKSAPVQVFAL